MELIPAIALMIFFLIIFIGVLLKLDNSELLKILKGTGTVLLVSAFLFMTVSLIYLFSAPPWAADLMKVIVGIAVGVAASSSISKSVDVGGINGDSNKVAGRDINEMIDNVEAMHGEVKEIKEAIIQDASSSQRNDLLFETIFSEKDEPINQAAQVIRQHGLQGWRLLTATKGYKNDEAFVLIFHRASKSDDIKVHCGPEGLEV